LKQGACLRLWLISAILPPPVRSGHQSQTLPAVLRVNSQRRRSDSVFDCSTTRGLGAGWLSAGVRLWHELKGPSCSLRIKLSQQYRTHLSQIPVIILVAKTISAETASCLLSHQKDRIWTRNLIIEYFFMRSALCGQIENSVIKLAYPKSLLS